MVQGRPVATVAECRSLGLWSLLDAVERHEVALRRWVRQTSKHGFRRPDAAKPNHTRGQWHPFWSPEGQQGQQAKPDANPAKHTRERKQPWQQ